MKINKSTRHAKITGDFGEAAVLYWLSKYGIECAPVDHTGIDIIARIPHTQEIMGISVKSRSRREGKENAYLTFITRWVTTKHEIPPSSFRQIFGRNPVL
jgi:hypothetical protein